jgi:hypothetical protein
MPQAGSRTRRLAVVGVLAAAFALLLPATGAQAASYRYWSFWAGSGTGWSYQQQGPNTYHPADGSVDGWRFGVSADSADAAKPRQAPDFAQTCGTTAPVTGKKRVAVVIDYGTTADSGSGATPPSAKAACVVLDQDASSAQALAQLAPPLRYDTDGILCAISGYPQSGCGEVVGDATRAADTATTTATAGAARKQDSAGATLGWAAGAALVVALGAGAFWQQRRRRSH